MINETLLIILFSVFCGLFYRLGGKGRPFNTKYRDFGTPFCALIILLTNWHPVNITGWVTVILFFGLSFASMTTYHDYLAPDGKGENWACWLMTGFCYGLSAFPLVWAGIHLYAVCIRTVLLAFLTMWWSEKIDTDWLEEFGRGFLIAITIPLLFL
jgi:hypothetical protein